MYLDSTNHLYFRKDIFSPDADVLIKKDPIEDAVIVNSISSNEDRDWVIVRGEDDFSGYLYRIFNWTSFQQSGAPNFNSEVTLGIDQLFDQTLIYNNSILLY